MIEAMKLALEALEAFLRFAAIHHDGPDVSDKYFAEDYAVEGFRKARQVLPALRIAIAEAEKQEPTGKQSLQVEQEPVAWLDESSGFIYHKTTHPERYTPLYKKREWVGLTEQDLSAIFQSCLTKLQAAISTEALLKEKNT
jgi:hypothetical protein